VLSLPRFRKKKAGEVLSSVARSASFTGRFIKRFFLVFPLKYKVSDPFSEMLMNAVFLKVVRSREFKDFFKAAITPFFTAVEIADLASIFSAFEITDLMIFSTLFLSHIDGWKGMRICNSEKTDFEIWDLSCEPGRIELFIIKDFKCCLL